MTTINNHYLDLPDDFYRAISPEPLPQAELIHSNHHLQNELGSHFTDEALLKITSGNSPELQSVAQKYTGHQFGYYNPDLGDGRGLLLGQVYDRDGQSRDLHLKGSGQTPFSRRGDGRAVLRSAIREYLVGEALHHLGVPTSRCLSLCHSPETVYREQPETRASYLRVAKTHVRFGHFEWLAQRQDKPGMQQLADYVIRHNYPHLQSFPEAERYQQLLIEIIEGTARLMAKWQTVGFCHGVMNTDNMSVAAETFDFGPFAFMDDFKIHYICNHTDTQGRYAYSQQPNIGLWNCQILASAFAPIAGESIQQSALDRYVEVYNAHYHELMAGKFGIRDAEKLNKGFIADTLILLDQSALDFHYFFLLLNHFDGAQHDQFTSYLPESKAWRKWLDQYAQLMQDEDNPQAIRTRNNPQLVLRNYIAQEIIEEAQQGRYQMLADWMQYLRTPFQAPEALHSYIAPPTTAKKGFALSCSS
ncbi:protein adenylyltransferase SelO family protein [Thiomicrorhabdus sp.]|uniref:protein adenylyltransferase SelO n=1 Tax=Thiomicrorhabdus sp. TaxID=2039724 RepID=UPI0029C61A6D|nr:YdiU family protein [Thiomicrorhabdus sp.]